MSARRRSTGPGTGEVSRKLLRAATRGLESDVHGLAARVPAAIDEARRRRAGTAHDLSAAVVPLARRWLPAMAAATAAAVAAALLAGAPGLSTTATGAIAEETYDRAMLTGAVGDAGTADPVLGMLLVDTEAEDE